MAGTIRERCRRWVHLLQLIWRADRRRAAILTTVVTVRSVAPLAFAVAAAVVVSNVPSAVRHGLSSTTGHRLLVALAVMGIAFAAQQISPAVQLTIADGLGRRFNSQLDRRLMRISLSPRGIGHLEDATVGDHLAGARRGVSGWPRPGDAVTAVGGRVALYTSLLSGSLLLAVFHVWAAFAVLVAALALQRRLATAMSALGESQAGRAAALRESAYLRDLALQSPAAKEVRLFGLGHWLVARHRKAWKAASAAMRAAQLQGQRSLLVATVTMCVVIGVVTGTLGWQVSRGGVGLAAVAVTLQGIALVTRSIGDEAAVRDGMVLGYAMAALAAADELEAHLVETSSHLVGVGRLEGSRPADGLPQREVRFNSVHFTYPGADREVLRGLDLVIPAATSLGIVGLNGAGKTTLIKLLCRLYEPSSGSITVDGTDIRELDPRSWQRRVAAIFQDFVHYPFSAAENVALGVPDQHLLDQAAASAALVRIVEGLPAGWETVLAPQFGGGIDVSGGQWQRFALARALYAAAAGASLLILDEPTASLDVRGEAEIYERFLELSAGRTTILISHRLSSVRRTDQIAVIDDGRLVELGSHDALVSQRGRYAELFDLQAAAFRREATTA